MNSPKPAGDRTGNQQFSELLSMAKSGDPEAVGQLCQVCHKYLLVIANDDLNPQMRQKFGASDVVQQSMIIANNKINQFRGTTKGEFLAWMKQILIHECRQASRGYEQTAKRAVSREQGISSNDSQLKYGIQVSDPHLTPSTQAAADEQVQLMQIALKQMGPLERQVIEMRNWDELSFENIGDEIGKTADAARKIWSRSIIKLEQELKKLNAI